MPRDGSGIYTRPPGTDAVTDTTIESTKYNGFVADVETDLNAVRPIIAGGTGGSSGAQARANMQAERAEQQITNYDSHAYETGSFWSAAGATNAPNGTDGFTGQVTRVADGAADKWTVAARSRQTGIVYARQKTGGGAWSAWTVDGSDRVAKIGDTMTGNLYISKQTPALILNSNHVDVSDQLQINMMRNNKLRWFIAAQGSVDESVATGLTGSDFLVARAQNDGTFKDVPFYISRATGNVGLGGIAPTAPLHVYHATASQIKLDTGSAGVSQVLLAEAGTSKGLVDYVTAGFGGGIANTMRVGSLTGGTPLTFLTGSVERMRFDGTNPIMTMSAQINTYGVLSPGTINGSTNSGLLVQSANSSSASYMTFHRQAWATNLGFDTDNQLKIGGISLGAAYRVVHEGLTNPSFPGTLAVSGSITSGGLIFTTANFYNRALAGVNATYYFQDENGTTTGSLTWERSSNRFVMQNREGRQITIENAGNVQLAGGFCSRAGMSGAFTTSSHNFQWTSVLRAWVDFTDLGTVSITSDYRIKKDVVDLPGMWDTVKALRPIKYTHKDFTPPSQYEGHAKLAAERAAAGMAALPEPGPFIKGDNIERWGFIAHELQETLVPSAASAFKDAPDAIQSLNIDCTVAALTKALQEAMARIEALEAKLAT